MEVEQVEIRNHLRQYPPFDVLPETRLDQLARQVEVAYFRAGLQIVASGQEVDCLHYVRSGAVEIHRRSGQVYNRLGEGEIFGQLALMTDKPARFSVRALEDTLIYFIPEALFRTLFEEEDAFADFVEVEDRTRLRHTASVRAEASEFATVRVGRLVRSAPVTVTESTRIRDAAATMSEHEVSSLIVIADRDRSSDTASVSPDAKRSPMIGIVTNEDMVTRALACGIDHERPVSEIMTRDPIAVSGDDFLFQGLNLMLRHNIHYLPVMARGDLIGVIDLADVVGLETQNSLFVVRNIFLRDSVEELKQLVPDVSATFVRMVNEDANSHMIGSAMAAIGRSFKQRLLELGEARFGPPPVPYCFLALGSMARDEQIMYSDQDNAMVLNDDYDPKRHGKYFRDLANFVCDGLAEVGYRYCKGDFMASNKRWRQPLQAWKNDFEKWIRQPKAEALLNGAVFFDLEGVAGEVRMAEELQEFVAERASQSQRFLGCMARNAQKRTPPLGFFKDFVLEKSGRYARTLNLKRRGTAPLVDVIRIHALASASQSQNSFRRLDDILAAGFLTSGMADDLRHALEFISIIRTRHQAFDIEAGRSPNNNIDPETLPSLERRSLKDAFTVLSNAQKFIKFRYRA
jgi:CBS domain-containing protein